MKQISFVVGLSPIMLLKQTTTKKNIMLLLILIAKIVVIFISRPCETLFQVAYHIS